MAYLDTPLDQDAPSAATPAPDTAGPTVTATAQRPRLAFDDIKQRAIAKGYSEAGADGIAQNFMRESGGNPATIGDHRTSAGLGQWHLDRLDALKGYAAKAKQDWRSPDVQFDFFDQEMRDKYPTLRKQLIAADDPAKAEDAFKRIYERPASVMWQTRPGNDKYQFSDDALAEHAGRKNTSIVAMSPNDYLDLSPPLEDGFGSDRQGKALIASLCRGEPVDSIPTLDINADGVTGTVADQDGRHRAVLAQQAGLDAIPVAIRGKSQDGVSELVGPSGAVVPNDFAKQPDTSRGGVLSWLGHALVPPAEAATVAAEPLDDPANDPRLQLIGPASEDKPPPTTTLQGIAASVGRGMAPYAAGALTGAGLGAALTPEFGGVGAIPGAAAGAGAVALSDLASGLSQPIAHMLGLPALPSASEGVNRLLDMIGIRRPQTGLERTIQTTTAGVGGAAAGVNAANMLAAILKNPAAKAVALQLAQRPTMQMVSGGMSGAASQGTAEAGLSPFWQQAAGLLASAAPFAKPGVGRIAASPAAKTAIEAGFVVHPADASMGHEGSVNPTALAAAEGGKIKLNQLASTHNQPVANYYVKRDLGIPQDTTLTPQAFRAVREREGQVYNEVADAVPEVDLAKDPQFVADVNKVGTPYPEETEKTFPSTAGNPDIANLKAELLRNARGPTRAVMHYIADLRMKAADNFRGDNAMGHRLARAQRDAANALEDSMERSVQNAPTYFAEKLAEATKQRTAAQEQLDFWSQPRGPEYKAAFHTTGGMKDLQYRLDQATANEKAWSDRLSHANDRDAENQTVVDRYRKARQIMAKSYDAESVTNVSTGDVNARGLGRLAQRGRPLTGGLKLIADTANTFPKAFQEPSKIGGVESYSVLDLAAAGLSAAHGGISGLASLLAVIGRPWMRSHIMSPAYQQKMIAPGPRGRGVPLSILGTPFMPTLSP